MDAYSEPVRNAEAFIRRVDTVSMYLVDDVKKKFVEIITMCNDHMGYVKLASVMRKSVPYSVDTKHINDSVSLCRKIKALFKELGF